MPYSKPLEEIAYPHEPHIVRAALSVTAQAEAGDDRRRHAPPVRHDGGGHRPALAQARRGARPRGEELVEIETDKANMTYESDREGALQTVAARGRHARRGRADRTDRRGGARRGPQRRRTPPARRERLPRRRAPVAAQPASAARPRIAGQTRGEDRVKASPLARRIAREHGSRPGRLPGSGPGGRIVKADVEAVAGSTRRRSRYAHARNLGPAPAQSRPRRPPPSVEGLAGAKGETTAVELSRTQRTIARRMAESKATIPDFTLTADSTWSAA